MTRRQPARRTAHVPAKSHVAQPLNGNADVVVDHASSEGLLKRLQPSAGAPVPAANREPASSTGTTRQSKEDRVIATLGCKTSEVAMSLLGQIVAIEHPGEMVVGKERNAAWIISATAKLAELHPTTALQAMLGTQMVATHAQAMRFLERATLPEHMTDVVDVNINRSARLMRLFLDQAEALRKLQGAGSQQKVVVEHVHVHQGGQAIVGSVTNAKSAGGGA